MRPHVHTYVHIYVSMYELTTSLFIAEFDFVLSKAYCHRWRSRQAECELSRKK